MRARPTVTRTSPPERTKPPPRLRPTGPRAPTPAPPGSTEGPPGGSAARSGREVGVVAGVALADDAGVSVDPDRDVAGDRDPVQQPGLVVEVGDRVVLGGPVVPDRDITGPPGPADGVLQPGDVPLQQGEQVVEVGRAQPGERPDKVAEQQRRLARLRVDTDDRVLGLELQ